MVRNDRTHEGKSRSDANMRTSSRGAISKADWYAVVNELSHKSGRGEDYHETGHSHYEFPAPAISKLKKIVTRQNTCLNPYYSPEIGPNIYAKEDRTSTRNPELVSH